MPFVPVENTVLVELRYDYLQQKVENTLWFLGDDPPDPTNMAALGEDIIGWWDGGLRELQNAGVSLREVVVTDMTTATGPQVTVTTGLPLTANVAEEPIPSSNSLVASFRTVSRGRSFRGRNYFVGLSRTQIDGNVVIGGFIESLTGAYETLLAGASTAGWTWVVASRFSGVDGDGNPIPRVAGITSVITTVLVVDAAVDSQRRRLNGRGT
jgi:hypothetical protein